MPEQDSIKARVMSNVRQLLKKERIELRSPESTSDEPEVAVEPGDAPLAVHSPNAVQQDQKHSRNAQAIVILEKIGPWLMIMSFALGITLCALAMLFYFGPTYVEAKINEAVAQSEGRTRNEAAQTETRLRAESVQSESRLRAETGQTETRLRAESAQTEVRVRSETSQDTADAKATAHLARTQALVALDKVEDLRVKLAQKNIDLPPLDGH